MGSYIIKGEKKQLAVNESDLSDSGFRICRLDRISFNDVSMQGVTITDANLSDLEIEGAQLGGAFIHNIGMPPAGHPMYDPNALQRPLRFENCDLSRSAWTDCNCSGGRITDCNYSGLVMEGCDLSGVALNDCQVEGMTINGIAVGDLLKKYYQS